MTDPLTRICGPSDLSSADRLRLSSELEFVAHVFSRIDRGAGFCEDRGFPWTAEMERAEGADRLLSRLREWPILRRLLPGIRHLRHETDPVIGRNPTPTDDVLVGELVLSNTRSFREYYGEGLGERAVTVRLEPDLIRVTEETLATALNGQPFDESEDAADYSADQSGSFWQRLRGKLPEGTWRRAAALAGRMAGTVLPCDACGRTSQTFTITGSVLSYGGPFAVPARSEVGPDALAVLRAAFAAHDLPAIRGLNPDWAKGYCVTCDASYCERHLRSDRDGVSPHSPPASAHCPLGHRLDD